MCVDSKPRISQAQGPGPVCVSSRQTAGLGERKARGEEYRVNARKAPSEERALKALSKRDFAKRRRCWPPFSTLLDKNPERVHLYMKYPSELIQRKCSLWCVL